MSETPISGSSCPYLKPKPAGATSDVTYAVYCERNHGRVRIPSRDEIQRFCAGGHYLDCPAFANARVGATFLASHA
jgi:hypothetical protein